jgi:hypothetical protein
MPTSGNRVLENFQLKTVDCRVRLIKALNLAFDTKTPIRIIQMPIKRIFCDLNKNGKFIVKWQLYSNKNYISSNQAFHSSLVTLLFYQIEP